MSDEPKWLAMAAKYIWWADPQISATSNRARLIAQIMDIGTWDDMEWLRAQLGDGVLIDTLTHAPAGQISPRSWAFWHARLGLKPKAAYPTRRFPDQEKRHV